MVKRSDKKKIQYSIAAFSLITIALFFITIPLEKKIYDSLSWQVQKALDSYEEKTYTVTTPIEIINTISTIAQFYSVETIYNTTPQVCLIRIMGISGPVTAVFLHEESRTTYITTIGYNNSLQENNRGITDNQIAYWENNITKVFEEHFINEEVE